jgi:hypothetical protein
VEATLWLALNYRKHLTKCMPRAGIECEPLQTFQTHSMAQVVRSSQFHNALTALWMQRKEARSLLNTTQIHKSEIWLTMIFKKKRMIKMEEEKST